MAVIDAPAEGHRRKSPFYTQLYFQVLIAIAAGAAIGIFFPTFAYTDAVDPVTGAVTEVRTRIPENAWVTTYRIPRHHLHAGTRH
ncbi:MAG: hypothetical protein H7Z40_03350 [Phycisphaerae bacterium]|nr:hypothetical protein [Gemmatimonadaceae bacterium]